MPTLNCLDILKIIILNIIKKHLVNYLKNNNYYSYYSNCCTLNAELMYRFCAIVNKHTITLFEINCYYYYLLRDNGTFEYNFEEYLTKLILKYYCRSKQLIDITSSAEHLTLFVSVRK